MPRTKSNSKRSTGNHTLPAVDVLTLEEAALYLRVSEEDVLRMVREQGLSGRLIGAEWRFLKSALRDWLSNPSPKSSKEALLELAGSSKDDPYLTEIVREAYRRRGRPITGAGE